MSRRRRQSEDDPLRKTLVIQENVHATLNAAKRFAVALSRPSQPFGDGVARDTEAEREAGEDRGICDEVAGNELAGYGVARSGSL
jgi:hypothetical protein